VGLNVHKVYYVPHVDQLVLAGTVDGRAPVPGGAIDLPREVRGPGWVPIHDVQSVSFAGVNRICVVLSYDVIQGAPMMEFSDLEGRILDVRPP
jgi:hypothetical protein